jgi:hypothetical protein
MPFKAGVVQNPKGRPKGSHEKTILKAEMAVRLEMLNLGYSDAQIALHIGMSLGSFKMLRKTDVYKRIFSQYVTGVIVPLDEKIRDNYSIGRKILTDAVPIALQNLVMAAAQKLDKKLQMEASRELLDREGSFSKVSRVGLPTKDQGGFADSKDNTIAADLLNALSTATKQEEVNKPPTIASEPASEKIM